MSSDPTKPTRTAPRYPAKFTVNITYRDWGQVTRLVTLNASRGGVFVRADKAPALGTALMLVVELPNQAKLELMGSVVHVITPEAGTQRKIPAGFGVRIDAAHASDLVLLESMAQSFDPSGPAAEFVQVPTGTAGVPVPVADEPTRRNATQPPPLPAEPDAARRGPSAEGRASSIQIRSDAAPIAIARITPSHAPAASRADLEIEDLPCQSEVVVGIDYGTSYSTIAAVRNGEAFIVRDPAGRWLVPSVVSYPETGGVLVGWDARERIATDPSHTVQSAKRLLGRKISDATVANYLAQMAYRAVPTQAGDVALDLGSAPISVPQVVAEVLRLLKRRAETALGTAVEDAVLVCPVTYEVPQRNALRKAAQLAGLRVVGMLDEPAAAALAYGFGRGRNEIAAVYDFGGGTFDFTLIDISKENFRIVAAAGDPWLGGDDFDHALATQAANEFWKQHKIELQKRVVEWQRLIFACESAKRTLTEAMNASVEVIGIARTQKGSLDLTAHYTRERFEELCRDLVSRTMDTVAQALQLAGLEPDDIGQVVLTSGVTRIPMVRRAVSEFFRRPIVELVHPEEAVALGASIQGAALAKQCDARVRKM